MEITAITKQNEAYFKGVIPDEAYARANLAIGAIDEKKPCGVLLAEVGEEDAELLWLFVSPEKRRCGCATLLLSAFTEFADKSKIPLTFFSLCETKDSKELLSFLEETGFVREFQDIGEILSFRMDGINEEQLVNIPAEGCLLLENVLRHDLSVVTNMLASEFEVSPTEEKVKAWKESSLSFVKKSGDHVQGYLLSRLTQNGIFLDYLHVKDRNPRAVMALVKNFTERLKTLCYPKNTKITAIPMTGDAKALLEHMVTGEIRVEGSLTVWTRRMFEV